MKKFILEQWATTEVSVGNKVVKVLEKKEATGSGGKDIRTWEIYTRI